MLRRDLTELALVCGLLAGASWQRRVSDLTVTKRRLLGHETRFAFLLPRSRNDFRRLHFIVEYGPISAMLCFEHSLDLEVVTIGHGRGVLNINQFDTNDRNRRNFSERMPRICCRYVNGPSSTQPLYLLKLGADDRSSKDVQRPRRCRSLRRQWCRAV